MIKKWVIDCRVYGSVAMFDRQTERGFTDMKLGYGERTFIGTDAEFKEWYQKNFPIGNHTYIKDIGSRVYNAETGEEII